MWTLMIIREIAVIIFYLSLPAFLFLIFWQDRNRKKKYDDLVDRVADKLLYLADDEKPIMLNVRQEKLIEKTLEEIEKREKRKWIRGVK